TVSGDPNSTGDVSITGTAGTNTTSSSKNDSNGFVGISAATANTDQYLSDSVYVGANSRIVATHNVTLAATASPQATGNSHSKGGGFVGTANAHTSSTIDYQTSASVLAGAYVQANGLIAVTAQTTTRETTTATGDGRGFGGDGRATASSSVGENGHGATDAVVLGAGATLFADRVSLSALVAGLYAHSSAAGYGSGFYSEGHGTADTEVNATNNVTIRGGGAAVTGIEGVDFITNFNNVDTYADGFARSTGLFGFVDGTATNNTDLHTTVEGDATALITAGPRDPNGDLAHPGMTRLAFYVSTDNGTLSVGENGHTSKRSLASGGGHDNGDAQSDAQEHKSILFSSDVTILSGRDPLGPQVLIDANGKVVTSLQATIYDSLGHVIAPGIAVPSPTIVVGDISNPGPGNVVFRASHASDTYLITDISGVSGTWTFDDALAKVAITNLSNLDIQINDIRVLSTAAPIVDLGGDSNVTAFTFNIHRTLGPTAVDIENLGTGKVIINGTIENPIGTTVIHNVGGAIQASNARGVAGTVAFPQTNRPAPCGGADGLAGTAHYSMICTNILVLRTDSSGQDIGQTGAGPRINVDYVQSATIPMATSFITRQVDTVSSGIFLGPNQFVSGEQVLYTTSGTAIGGLTSGSYYFVTESSDGLSVTLSNVAGGAPIVLTANSAHLTDGQALTPVQLFTVNSAASAYLDVRGLQRGPAASPPPFIVRIDHVSTVGDADLLLQTSMLQSGTGIGGGVSVIYPSHASPGQTHYTFFNQPDTACLASPTPTSCVLQVAAFGTGSTKIDSTYDFRAFDASGNPTRPGLTAGGNIVVKYADVLHDLTFNANTIYILGITELYGASLAEATGHIDVLTNGWIGQPAVGT
ncbi:MAG: large repetitive protein, partial [Mycobacterium sp.]|nr:large repetitive protein [Mycobacterium sp.]